MTLVYIGVFIMALSFALVSIFIVKLLLRTSSMISTLGQSVSDVETNLDKTIIKMEETIVESEKTANDVETKLLAANSLFLAVKNVGDTTALISEDIHSRTKRYAAKQSLPGTMPFVRAILVGEFGHGLLRSWKKGRNASS